jgi:hypothetical protein
VRAAWAKPLISPDHLVRPTILEMEIAAPA